MSSASSSRVIRAPGRIVVAPTDLSIAYPFGGVEIGWARGFVLISLGNDFRVEAEGLGEAGDILEGPINYVATCFLRGWDKDALQQLWADNYAAGTSGNAVFNVPGTVAPGSSALTRAKVILFAADDRERSPSVLILRGVPNWDQDARLSFGRPDELGLPLSVQCIRNTGGRILQIGMLGDLSLTP